MRCSECNEENPYPLLGLLLVLVEVYDVYAVDDTSLVQI